MASWVWTLIVIAAVVVVAVIAMAARRLDARHLARLGGQLIGRPGPAVSPAGPAGRPRVASPSGLPGWPCLYQVRQSWRPACGAGLRTSDRYRPGCPGSTTAGPGTRCRHRASSGSGAGGCRTASTRRRRCAGPGRAGRGGVRQQIAHLDHHECLRANSWSSLAMRVRVRNPHARHNAVRRPRILTLAAGLTTTGQGSSCLPAQRPATHGRAIHAGEHGRLHPSQFWKRKPRC